MKLCEKCQKPARKDSRFCPRHYNEAIAAMRQSGYLQDVRYLRPNERNRDQKENIEETKHGAHP